QRPERVQGPGRWRELGQKRVQRQGRLRDRRKQAAAKIVIKPKPPILAGARDDFVREGPPLCFPSRSVLVRAGQEQSDRTEPVPPELPENVLKIMPANPFNGFTEYGIGIGLRGPHYRHTLWQKPVVSLF